MRHPRYSDWPTSTLSGSIALQGGGARQKTPNAASSLGSTAFELPFDSTIKRATEASHKIDGLGELGLRKGNLLVSAMS
jgi:hypothetical protein